MVQPPPPPPRQPIGQFGAPPPPPPVSAPSPPAPNQPALVTNAPFDVANFGRQYRASVHRTFRESTSFYDIFDWKFEKYLTPWIVRLNWILALVFASLWIVSVTGSTIWSFLPSDAQAISPSRSTVPFQFAPQPREERMSVETARLLLAAFRIISAAAMIAFTIQMLLMLRLSLEFAIVLFNIAKTVESIDEKSSVPDPAR